MKHKITRIRITFKTYYYSLTGRVFNRWVMKEQIVETVRFLRRILDVQEIEIVCLDRRRGEKSYYDEEKLPRKVILGGINVTLNKPLEKTYQEEYEEIYKPINDFLMRMYIPIYNMWGYGENTGCWQMDGRHIHLDRYFSR